MFLLHLPLTPVCLLACVALAHFYNPRNISHDSLSDDMNNVREGMGEENLAELGWDTIFQEIYDDEKKKSEKGTNFNQFQDETPTNELRMVGNWPSRRASLGQVAGLSLDSRRRLHVLHRANRKWGRKTFDTNNEYAGDHRTIQANTLIVLDSKDGRVVEEWGRKLFAMPHGLEIDRHDNLYVTDVALHQVFKFKAGQHDPVLSLGEAYSPATSNEDLRRFCQPTAVAAAANGDFFVADGYCNSRLLKYRGDGSLVGVFGKKDSNLPHSMALIEGHDLLCVADREGMRVLCYNAGMKSRDLLGTPVIQYIHPRVGPVFAIAYNSNDSLIYGVTGRSGALKAVGFTLDALNNPTYPFDFVAFWSPSQYHHGDEEEEHDDEDVKNDDDTHEQEFTSPHAIATKGKEVFVGQTEPPMLWKFKKVL